MLDREVTTDVSETSTVWSNILPLYQDTIAAICSRIQESGVSPWAGCHVSHTYQSGASVYFTFGFRQQLGCEMEQYLRVKRAAQQSFIDHGATLSHHHAVGLEHAKWLSQDISPVGVVMIRSLLEAVDPGHNFNPGKIVD